jgi:cysteine desulfurase/selenocysteine lyase
MFNINKIRRDFPILSRKISGKKLVYFDNAATSQKPKSVISSMVDYYENHNANVHRGIHTLASEATNLYEGARTKIKNFINAKTTKEIIFTKNITESLNLVAYTWGRKNLQKGDEVLLTVMEHHSDIVPWQIVAQEKQAVLKFIDINENGMLDIASLHKLLSKKTKIVGIAWVSNALGTINPVEKIIKLAHEHGALVLIDAAQYAPHDKIDVQKLDCDFLGFTGHKMLGPMGTGILYVKEKILEGLPPFLGGGDMIKEVYFDHAVYNELPYKFEAGTPNVGGAIGLGSAIDYLSKIGFDNIRKHEKNLTAYGLKALRSLKNVTLYGPADINNRMAILNFNINGIHPHDVAQILDNEGIAIRVGHHCTMPLHLRLSLNASCRASLYLYNTVREIDKLCMGIEKVKKVFGK